MQFLGYVGFEKGEAQPERIHRHDDQRRGKEKDAICAPSDNRIVEILRRCRNFAVNDVRLRRSIDGPARAYTVNSPG